MPPPAHRVGMSDLPSPDDRADAPDPPPALPAGGDLLVRNHDAEAHHLAVRAYDGDGAVVAAAGVHLAGGTTVARSTSLSAGTYTVEADCDGHRSAAYADGRSRRGSTGSRYVVTTCELADDEGLLVAVGNGVVDVVPRPSSG